MYNVILIGVGGFVGSAGRYLTYLLVSTYFNHSFPIATLLVNTIGCFAIGALSATVGHYAALSNPRILLLLTTGNAVCAVLRITDDRLPQQIIFYREAKNEFCLSLRDHEPVFGFHHLQVRPKDLKVVFV